ncbi:MAG: cytochrome c [Deltaproteobacteria bacterium]|nr:cytochrome c [Deltaproteobacteria bacterium]
MNTRALLPTLLLLLACEGRGERREWTAADHHGEQRGRGQVAASAEAREDATLIEVTWRQNCAVCHGLAGRGDTQQGQMLRVPDLSRPELGAVADDALVATIRRGRNKMPAFDKLPERVVRGLVAHIRSFGR